MFNIKTDSRKIKKGDIFVALKGIKSNGDDYVSKAISLGASKIISSTKKYDIDTEVVPDTRKYLEDYLEKNYGKYLDEMTLICVTGTNGKTTTAYLIYELLNMLGKKCGYVGSVGYYLDKFICEVPNSTPDICDMYEYIIEAYEKGYRYFAIEGSSQGIDYGRLNTFKFDYVIFTNLTHEHLDYHKTMENYMLTKKRVFYQLKKDGKAIINIDDMYSKNYILDENTNILYGMGNADYKISDVVCGLDKTSFKLNGIDIISPLQGEFNVYNLVPPLAILDDLGINKSEYMRLIPRLKEPEGRNEKIPYKDNLVVVDYAHTPDGFEKIAQAYQSVGINDLYIVFGACGNRDRTKRPLMLKTACKYAKYVIVTDYNLNGEDGNQIIEDVTKDAVDTNFEVIRDRKKAIEKGISLLKEKDVLLILGHGQERYLDIGNKKIEFDDRVEAKKIIDSLTK